MVYVNVGCGFDAGDGWLNFDASPTLRFERVPVLGRLYTKNDARFPESVRYGDIVKGIGRDTTTGMPYARLFRGAQPLLVMPVAQPGQRITWMNEQPTNTRGGHTEDRYECPQCGNTLIHE